MVKRPWLLVLLPAFVIGSVAAGWLRPLAGAAATPLQEDTISVTLSNQTVPRYRVVELSVAYRGAPFPDVWEGPEIKVTFSSPTDRRVTVGGFYHADNTWKVRFAPSEPGTWRWSLAWADTRGTQTAGGFFRCMTSAERGFIRPNLTNPFRLVYEDGALYPALGITDCLLDLNQSGSPLDDWGLDGGFRPAGEHGHGSLTDIDTYLNTYGRAGFNLFRWSVDNCAFRLWDRIEPGGNTYLEREGVWGDTLVAKLRQNGFRVYMTFFGSSPPFPNDARDPEKMAAVKRYVKYVVDRYGAYVDFWELMNEYPSPPQTISDEWYAVVAGHLREVDPYGHMISTSWERPDHPAIEVNAPHWYEKESEFASDAAAVAQIERARRAPKPIIFGEQGNTGQNWDERSALRLRIRAWTAFFAEAALVFWNASNVKDFRNDAAANIYLGPEERGYVKVLQDFVARAEPGVEKLSLTPASPGIRGYGLRSPGLVFGYFHHFSSHTEPVRSSLTVELPRAGVATWIDPATGMQVGATAVGGGRQTLTIPAFIVDVALRLELEPEALRTVSVSAASFRPALATESIAAAFGAGLATATASAGTNLLPPTLGGTEVRVRDSAGSERPAPLFFVSPHQVNYLIPAGTVAGPVTVRIKSGDGSVSRETIEVARLAPALFAANGGGAGAAAGVVLRVSAGGAQSFEPILEYDAAQGRLVARPIDLGPEGDQVYLILFGTGLRFHRAFATITARVGGSEAPVLYLGAQPNFAGLDQVNLLLPRELAGRGEVDLLLIVEGLATNLVEISVR